MCLHVGCALCSGTRDTQKWGVSKVSYKPALMSELIGHTFYWADISTGSSDSIFRLEGRGGIVRLCSLSGLLRTGGLNRA